MRSSQKYAQQSRVGVAVKSKCGGEDCTPSRWGMADREGRERESTAQRQPQEEHYGNAP